MSKKVCSISESSINELPEDLILTILSFLPTKHVVVTSLLSKKWKSLWTKVPRLEYNAMDHKDYTSFELFMDKSLLSHQSHVLESVSFKNYWVNIGQWIDTVFRHHHCHLRELEIDASGAYTPLPHELFTCKTLVVLKLKGELIRVADLTTVSLPSLKTLHIEHMSALFKYESLQMLLSNCNYLTDLKITVTSFTIYVFEFDVSWCKTLVALKLKGLTDVISISSPSSRFGLPFLNTLHVTRMKSLSNDSFCRLLSHCPLLSDLTLDEKTSHVMVDLDIAMPCLQRLSIYIPKVSTVSCSSLEHYIRNIVTMAPSLRYFSIQVELSYIYSPFYMRVRLEDPSKLEYTSIFQRIVQVEMRICCERSQKLLVDLLHCSTKLVSLKLENVYKLSPIYTWTCVPECLLSSLEALEWRGYTGRDMDRGYMSYLLKHALCLKTVHENLL
ncbi:hypothetical protein CARUB_v10028117mg [Capsella rubella]|uniref:F-box domain-containing protein n=1 Tax=Capsella rubella TaxID=81985 RepID=R0GR30_9BRAS|nr:hypothetical protein CARUB_v10028117mg [Capsella rubella]